MKSLQTLKKVSISIAVVAVFALILQNIQSLILPVSLEFYTFGNINLPIGIWLGIALLLGILLTFCYELPLLFSKNKALKVATKELATFKQVEEKET